MSKDTMNEDTTNEDTGTGHRLRTEVLRLAAASLLGGLVVFAATEVKPMVTSLLSTEKSATANSAPAWAEREIPEEWKWKPNPVKYEHMYRKTHQPRRDPWIRGSGR